MENKFKVKNGVETQNVKFVSPDKFSNIETSMLDNATLEFNGSVNGNLFSIKDSFEGTIFSVNNSEGFPSVEIDNDGTILLAELNGNVGVGVDNPTEKFEVLGTVKSTNIEITGFLKANGVIGSSGQVLTSDGEKAFWSTEVGFTGSQGIQGDIGFTGSQGLSQQTFISDTPPSPAENGELWFDTTDTTLNLYYDDGDSQQWITTSGPRGELGYTGSKGDNGDTGVVIEQITEVTSSRTLILSDSNDMVFANSSSNLTLTIPNDTTTDFPIATTIHFARNGTGTVTIDSEAGVTVRIRNGFTNTLAVQYSIASATKVAANTWYLYGDLT
jgi:hypothetical protein